MPVKRHETTEETPTQVWKNIYQADKANYIMTASCLNQYEGLTTGHAYTLVSAVKVRQGGKVHKLVKMRNPWGTEGYKGPWSDKDPRWTKGLLRKLGHKDANDGFFFMPMEGFLKAFTDYEVLHYKDWKQSSKKVTGKSKPTYSFTLKNPIAQEVFLTFDGLPPSAIPKGCQKDKYSYDLSLYNAANENDQHLGSVMDAIGYG